MGNQDPDIHCFAYALAVSLKLQSESYYKMKIWSAFRNKVKHVVNQLHRKAGVQPVAVSPENYDAFQAILP